MSRKRGRAAFAPEDVPDAERGHPAHDLGPWAAAHGLEGLGQALPSGFVSVVPVWPDYVFGCARGTYDDEYVTVMHELYEVGVSQDGIEMGGGFWGVRSHGRWSWLGLWESGPRNEPFATNAVWVPATRAAARVTQAALVPRLCVRRSDRLPRVGSRDLGPFGVPGFRLADGDHDERFLSAFLGGEAGGVLRALPHPFVEVVVDAGHVALVRNGYAAPAELDGFAGALTGLARGLRTAAAGHAVPADLDARLPPPPWVDPAWRSPDRLDVLSDGWRDAYRRAAFELGLELEDPTEFHRAFPAQPVPGRAQGVLRGPVPGVADDARVAWFADGEHPLHGWVRGAVVFRARPGAATPRGGLRDAESGMQGEVVDGIAACWTVRRTQHRLDAAPLVAAAATTAGRLGLV